MRAWLPTTSWWSLACRIHNRLSAKSQHSGIKGVLFTFVLLLVLFMCFLCKSLDNVSSDFIRQSQVWWITRSANPSERSKSGNCVSLSLKVGSPERENIAHDVFYVRRINELSGRSINDIRFGSRGFKKAKINKIHDLLTHKLLP